MDNIQKVARQAALDTVRACVRSTDEHLYQFQLDHIADAVTVAVLRDVLRRGLHDQKLIVGMLAAFTPAEPPQPNQEKELLRAPVPLMAANPRERIIAAHTACFLPSQRPLAAAREALTVIDERILARMTPALNHGSAWDALALVGAELRDLRAQLARSRETPDGDRVDDFRNDPAAANRLASLPIAQAVTPGAALLDEAGASMTSINGPTFSMMAQLVRRLSAALRAALDREREMRKEFGYIGDLKTYIETILDDRNTQWERAEQAERDRDALAAELQRLQEGR